MDCDALRELFNDALVLPPEQREAMLRRLSEPDRREVESLLEAHDAASGFFSERPAIACRAERTEPDHDRRIGTRIGRYRIESVLAIGGMGVVYLARQDSPDRLIALKLLRPGFATPEMLRRFRHEAEILGRLDHPGIASIIEAGTHHEEHTRAPQPWIAMEYIDGVPLTTYIERAQIDLRAKMGLLMQICEALQHAHLNGVIHRDIKPANMLVVDYCRSSAIRSHSQSDDPRSNHSRPTTAQVRILDFGVGRLLDQDRQRTLVTEVGEIVGTLAYMSPEQVTAKPEEIDARTDVYSLGLVMYEALSGRAPHDLNELSLPEAARVIRDVSPPRLGAVCPECRGDVETIVHKAIEKEKQRRYQSASELAADIGRYLNAEPILARNPSAFYLLRTFARRNRPLVAGVAGIFLMLVAGMMATTWQAREAKRQTGAAIAERSRAGMAERLAETEARTAQATSQFLRDLLGSIHPAQAQGHEVTVREALESAAPRIDREFAAHPRVRGALHRTVGETYQGLGHLDLAERHLQTALSAFAEAEARDDPEALNAQLALAGTLAALGRFEESEDVLRGLEESGIAIGAVNDEVVLRFLSTHATMLALSGRDAEAEAAARQALAMHESALGPRSRETIEARRMLAERLSQRGQYGEAEEQLRVALEHAHAALGLDDLTSLTISTTLAMLHRRQGRLDEAERLYVDLIERYERVLGEKHPYTLTNLNNLAALYRHQGRIDEAERLQRKVLATRREVLGPEHPSTLVAVNNLAVTLQQAGRLDEALPLFRDSLEGRRRELGGDHPATVQAIANLGSLARDSGRLDEAEQLTREAVEIGERIFGHGDVRLAKLYNQLAAILSMTGRDEDVILFASRALKVFRQTVGPDDRFTRGTIRGLAEAYLRTHQPEDAKRLLDDAWEEHERSEQRDETHAARLADLRSRAETALHELPGTPRVERE